MAPATGGPTIYRGARKVRTSKVITSKKVGARWMIDTEFFPPTTYKGKAYVGIMVFVDVFSKLSNLVPVSGESGEEAVRATKTFLEEIEKLHPGAAKRVSVFNSDDRGLAFTSQEFTDYLKEHGIKPVYGAAYSPQSQGLAERQNRTIASYVTSWTEQRFHNRKRWVELVSDVEHLINHSYARATGKDPISVFTQDDPHEEVLDKLMANAAKRQVSHLENDKLAPGTLVRVSFRVRGPTRIKGQIKQGTRKGYLQQWTNEVYKVVRGWGAAEYILEDTDGNLVRGGPDGAGTVQRVLRFNRADLLKLPDGEQESYHGAEESEDETEEPRAKRAKQPVNRIIETIS